MAIKITNLEADEMIELQDRDAAVSATRKELDRRQNFETPIHTAERLRIELGIELSDRARLPLPKSVYDQLSDEWFTDLQVAD